MHTRPQLRPDHQPEPHGFCGRLVLGGPRDRLQLQLGHKLNNDQTPRGSVPEANWLFKTSLLEPSCNEDSSDLSPIDHKGDGVVTPGNQIRAVDLLDHVRRSSDTYASNRSALEVLPRIYPGNAVSFSVADAKPDFKIPIPVTPEGQPKSVQHCGLIRNSNRLPHLGRRIAKLDAANGEILCRQRGSSTFQRYLCWGGLKRLPPTSVDSDSSKSDSEQASKKHPGNSLHTMTSSSSMVSLSGDRHSTSYYTSRFSFG